MRAIVYENSTKNIIYDLTSAVLDRDKNGKQRVTGINSDGIKISLAADSTQHTIQAIEQNSDISGKKGDEIEAKDKKDHRIETSKINDSNTRAAIEAILDHLGLDKR